YLRGRVRQELVDIHLVRTWVHHCDSNHGKACKPAKSEDSYWMPSWVIDVQTRTLVPGKETGREGAAVHYAALSYVWGPRDVPQLKHTIKDKDALAGRLKNVGGLADHWGDIPNTLRDAMTLCQEIGIPYLWVDAVYLEQDNITKVDLDSMGRVYRRAYLTIVAAAGEDSWAGLPGVQRQPRVHRGGSITEKIDDISIGLYAGPCQKIIQDSKWNTRAWTFQEMIFSRRLLIFTKDEVVYECDSDVLWRETVFSEHPDLPSRSFLIPSTSSTTKPQLPSLTGYAEKGYDAYNQYIQILKLYTRRQMTDSSDVLNAVQGILAEIEEATSQPFSYGIPLIFAYHYLLFDIIGYCDDLRRPKFPSWSWCGWQNISVVEEPSSPGLLFYELLCDVLVQAYNCSLPVGPSS
ncbi:heterokaryon incompatibility protein-domain-containing protein, partial [Apodospora peruviana]